MLEMEAEGDRGVGWLSYNMNNASSDFQGRPILDEIKGHVHSLCRETRRNPRGPLNSPVPGV